MYSAHISLITPSFSGPKLNTRFYMCLNYSRRPYFRGPWVTWRFRATFWSKWIQNWIWFTNRFWIDTIQYFGKLLVSRPAFDLFLISSGMLHMYKFFSPRLYEVMSHNSHGSSNSFGLSSMSDNMITEISFNWCHMLQLAVVFTWSKNYIYT